MWSLRYKNNMQVRCFVLIPGLPSVSDPNLY